MTPKKCMFVAKSLTDPYMWNWNLCVQLYKHGDTESSELCELTWSILPWNLQNSFGPIVSIMNWQDFIAVFIPQFLITSDYYIVPSPSTALELTLPDIYVTPWRYKLFLKKCLIPLFLSWIDKTLPLFSVVQTRWSRMFWTLWMQSGWSFVMQGSWMHWKGCLQHRSGLLQPCFAILSSLPWPMSVLLGLICLLKTP